MIQDRFKGTIWYKYIQDNNLFACVGGVGGIGSWTALWLNRMRLLLTVIDYDTIEDHNVGGQFYRNDSRKQYKVSAILDNLRNYGDTSAPVTALNEEYIDGSFIGDINFAGFDKIAPRKIMFNNFCKYLAHNDKAVYIDIRLKIDMYQIFVVTADNLHLYDNDRILFDSKDLNHQENCTQKQCSHVAAMATGHAVSLLTNYLSNLSLGREVFKVPFFTEHNILSQVTTNENSYDLL